MTMAAVARRPSSAHAAGLALDDAALVVDQEQRVERGVEDGLELLIALAQRDFGLQPQTSAVRAAGATARSSAADGDAAR